MRCVVRDIFSQLYPIHEIHHNMQDKGWQQEVSDIYGEGVGINLLRYMYSDMEHDCFDCIDSERYMGPKTNNSRDENIFHTLRALLVY